MVFYRSCILVMLPGQTGLMVKANDSDDLVAVVWALVVDAQRRRTIGQVARQYVEERSFDASFGKMWEL